MEDAATAEISRAQVWQWIRHRGVLADGRWVDAQLCRAMLAEELDKLRGTAAVGADQNRRYEAAVKLFLELIEAPGFSEYLTLPAYELITAGLI